MWQLFAFLSAIFSALAAILEKKALLKNDPLIFSLALSVITLIFSLPFLVFADFTTLHIETIWLMYLKSLLGALAFLLVMHGLQRCEISNSLPLLVFTPAIVAILAFLLLNENIGFAGISGMVILLIGTYLLQLEKNKGWLSPFLFLKQNKSFWFIIGAIALFSTTSILDKTLLKSYKLQPELFLPLQQFFFSVNFFLLFIIKQSRWKQLKCEVFKNWKIILLIALIAIIYRYMHILAIKSGYVAFVLSIKRTSVFFATVFGGRYFTEHNLKNRSLAVATMVIGVIIIIISKP